MKYKIEKGIKLPDVGLRGARQKYPFASMEVGDSFEAGKEELTRMKNAAWSTTARKGYRFSFRTKADKFRCWRIA